MMEIKLQQRLSQQLVMTTQMQQSMKILQMGTVEVDAYVEQELMENPTLERDDDDNYQTVEEWDSALAEDGSVLPSTMEQEPEDGAQAEEQSLSIDDNDEAEDYSADEITPQMAEDIDWDSYRDNNDNFVSSSENRFNHDDSEPVNYENFVSDTDTLLEHLEWQIQVGAEFSDQEKKVAAIIIGYFDERGYLPENIIEQLVSEINLPASFIENVLKKVQRLDPVGVGARSLVECLTVQAKDLAIKNPLVYKIIGNYLEAVGANKIPYIANQLDCTEKAVLAAIHLIKQLEPVPARNFFYTPAVDARPDVIVHHRGDDFVVTVETGYGRLHLNKEYKQMLGRRGRINSTMESGVRDYLHEQMNRAKLLLDTLHTREETLQAVTMVVVELQREFFETGDPCTLKPLILRDVAERLELNESTVSRITIGKYVLTDHGLLPMRFFFNAAIGDAAGEDVAVVAIKKTIADLIKKEDPQKPLSDQQLVEILSGQGMNVARRTVAKYREVQKIPSSSMRKRTI